MPLFTTRKKKQDIKLTFQDDMLFVLGEDGKEQAFPLMWLPKLKNASDEERSDWTQTDTGIHFNRLDVDITYNSK